MKKKEIKEKFEILDQQIKSLVKRYEDLYEVTQFILEAIGKNSDEPIYRVRKNDDWYSNLYVKKYTLRYVYGNEVKEIETYEDIQSTELCAYCDTHFILKNHNNKYFLVNMKEGIITNIPARLLFSKEKSMTIEGQTLKFYQSTSCIGIKRSDND